MGQGPVLGLVRLQEFHAMETKITLSFVHSIDVLCFHPTNALTHCNTIAVHSIKKQLMNDAG